MPTIVFTHEERARIDKVLHEHDPAVHPLTKALGEDLPVNDWAFICEQIRSGIRSRLELNLMDDVLSRIEATQDEDQKRRHARLIHRHFCPDGPSERFYAPTSTLRDLAAGSMRDERGGA